ncbi:MAG: pilin, partial [Ignavibacteria bacterium]|nr:pilin [Ignavibacteria bacterium]
MRFITKRKNLLLLVILVGLFFTFLLVNASDNGEKKLQTNWPPSPVIRTSLDKDSTLPTLIKYIYEWGIALGGLAAFIALIIAGLQYLTSMGDPGQMKEAFGRIRSAFFGIILLLSSLLILNTINPDLASLRLAKPLERGELPEVEKHKVDI